MYPLLDPLELLYNIKGVLSIDILRPKARRFDDHGSSDRVAVAQRQKSAQRTDPLTHKANQNRAKTAKMSKKRAKPHPVYVFGDLPVEISVENVENSWAMCTKSRSDNANQLLKHRVSVPRGLKLKICFPTSVNHAFALFNLGTASQNQ